MTIEWLSEKMSSFIHHIQCLRRQGNEIRADFIDEASPLIYSNEKTLPDSSIKYMLQKAELLLLTLRGDHYDALADHYGITKEGEERRRLSEAQTDEGTRFFGGRTIYGGLLDFALSRYGWTLAYCLWEISYFNLRMLVADATTSVYLSEEERKRLGSSRINADDPRNRELIRDLLRD